MYPLQYKKAPEAAKFWTTVALKTHTYLLGLKEEDVSCVQEKILSMIYKGKGPEEFQVSRVLISSFLLIAKRIFDI